MDHVAHAHAAESIDNWVAEAMPALIPFQPKYHAPTHRCASSGNPSPSFIFVRVSAPLSFARSLPITAGI